MITSLTAWARTWRVPSAGTLQRMSDNEAAALWGMARRRAVKAAVESEMDRRDRLAREEARRGRAAAKRAELREEYDLYVHAAWLAAESDCCGYLLSRAGRDAGAGPAALWPMHESRAMRYASQELRDWWRVNGRWTFRQWQRQAREQRPERAAVAT